MADVQVHPSTLTMLRKQRAVLQRFVNNPEGAFDYALEIPAYIEETKKNAASCGLSIEAMHARGVDNFVVKARAKIDELDHLLLVL